MPISVESYLQPNAKSVSQVSAVNASFQGADEEEQTFALTRLHNVAAVAANPKRRAPGLRPPTGNK